MDNFKEGTECEVRQNILDIVKERDIIDIEYSSKMHYFVTNILKILKGIFITLEGHRIFWCELIYAEFSNAVQMTP